MVVEFMFLDATELCPENYKSSCWLLSVL